MSKREAQIILKTDEQQGGARTRPRRKIRRPQAFGPAAGRRAGQALLRDGRVTVSLRSDGVTATLQHRCVTLSPVAVETGNGVDDEWSASKARAELVDVAAGGRAISAIAVSMLTHTLSPTVAAVPLRGAMVPGAVRQA
jgi:hypothetical protein